MCAELAAAAAAAQTDASAAAACTWSCDVQMSAAAFAHAAAAAVTTWWWGLVAAGEASASDCHLGWPCCPLHGGFRRVGCYVSSTRSCTKRNRTELNHELKSD